MRVKIIRAPDPDLRPGVVIRYAYLWRNEAAAGREEAAKDRPCAIVLTTKRAGDRTTVVVAPITHAPPTDPKAAVEIPAAAKARLGLDHAPSWVITTDLNYFTWPGPDLRPVDSRKSGRGFVYGQLSQGLTNAILDRVREHLRQGRIKPVSRDEAPPPKKD